MGPRKKPVQSAAGGHDTRFQLLNSQHRAARSPSDRSKSGTPWVSPVPKHKLPPHLAPGAQSAIFRTFYPRHLATQAYSPPAGVAPEARAGLIPTKWCLTREEHRAAGWFPPFVVGTLRVPFYLSRGKHGTRECAYYFPLAGEVWGGEVPKKAIRPGRWSPGAEAVLSPKGCGDEHRGGRNQR